MRCGFRHTVLILPRRCHVHYRIMIFQLNEISYNIRRKNRAPATNSFTFINLIVNIKHQMLMSLHTAHTSDYSNLCRRRRRHRRPSRPSVLPFSRFHPIHLYECCHARYCVRSPSLALF